MKQNPFVKRKIPSTSLNPLSGKARSTSALKSGNTTSSVRSTNLTKKDSISITPKVKDAKQSSTSSKKSNPWSKRKNHSWIQIGMQLQISWKIARCHSNRDGEFVGVVKNVDDWLTLENKRNEIWHYPLSVITKVVEV
jgi:hypothetical protein